MKIINFLIAGIVIVSFLACDKGPTQPNFMLISKDKCEYTWDVPPFYYYGVIAGCTWQNMGNADGTLNVNIRVEQQIEGQNVFIGQKTVSKYLASGERSYFEATIWNAYNGPFQAFCYCAMP